MGRGSRTVQRFTVFDTRRTDLFEMQRLEQEDRTGTGRHASLLPSLRFGASGHGNEAASSLSNDLSVNINLHINYRMHKCTLCHLRRHSYYTASSSRSLGYDLSNRGGRLHPFVRPCFTIAQRFLDASTSRFQTRLHRPHRTTACIFFCCTCTHSSSGS